MNQFGRSAHTLGAHGHLFTQATIFFTVVPDIFIIITAVLSLHVKMCLSSYALSRNCQITVRFTGHFKIVGPEYGTCLLTPFLCMKFGGEFLKIGGPKISAVYNCYVRGLNLLTSVRFTSDQHGNICYVRYRVYWALIRKGKRVSYCLVCITANPCHLWVYVPEKSNEWWNHDAWSWGLWEEWC
jgi:hypothetical protein